jgi:hypothetical protein
MVRFAVILHNLLGGHLYEYVTSLFLFFGCLGCLFLGFVTRIGWIVWIVDRGAGIVLMIS